MNAARYYKFFLNLSPAILTRHQLLSSALSKAQGNTPTREVPSRRLGTNAGCWAGPSIPRLLPRQGPLTTRRRRRRRSEGLNPQQVSSYLVCHQERKSTLEQTRGAAAARAVGYSSYCRPWHGKCWKTQKAPGFQVYWCLGWFIWGSSSPKMPSPIEAFPLTEGRGRTIQLIKINF